LLGSRGLYNQLDYTTRRLNGLIGDAGGTVGRVDNVFKTINNGLPKVAVLVDTVTTGVTGLVSNMNDLTNRVSVVMNSLDTTLRDTRGMVNGIITDGTQTINKADDFMSGVSKFWFLRSKIPQKDSVPLLEDTW